MIKIVPTGTSAFISTGMRKQRTVKIPGRPGGGAREAEFHSAHIRLLSQWSGNRITASIKCKNSVFVSFVKLELHFRTPRRNSLLSTWTESYSNTQRVSSIKNCPGTMSQAVKRTGAWAMWLSETREAEGMFFYQSPPANYPVLFSCNKIAKTLSIQWEINRKFQKDENLPLPVVDILRGSAQMLVTQWRNLWKSSLNQKLAPRIRSSWCTSREIKHPEHIQSTLMTLKNSGISVDSLALGPSYASELGDWMAPEESFRGKMGQISRFISDSHMVPGIRFAPFLVSGKSILAKNHPGWLVRNSRDKLLKVNNYENKPVYVLDVTKPEVLEHIRKTVNLMLARWGFRAFILERISDVAVRGMRANSRIPPGQLLRLATKSLRDGTGKKVFITADDVPLPWALDSINSRITATSFTIDGNSKSRGNRNKILMNTIASLHRSEWSNAGWLCASGLLTANLMDTLGNIAATSLRESIQMSCSHVLLGGDPEKLRRTSTERLILMLKQNKRTRRGSTRQLSYSTQLDKEPLILKSNHGNIGIFNLSTHTQKVVLDKNNIKRSLNIPSNLKVNDAVVLNSPEIHVFVPPMGSRLFTL